MSAELSVSAYKSKHECIENFFVIRIYCRKRFKRLQMFILLTFFEGLLPSFVMKNVLNLLKTLLLVLSLVIVSPSAFAAEDVELQFQTECKHAGYYKVIIRNGWADQAFPMPVSGSKLEWIPS